MLYKLTLEDDTDISDYVTDIDKVPYLTKNRDGTLIVEGYKFKISHNAPYTPVTNDKVYFWRETTLIHNGIIGEVVYDEEDRKYEVEVKHFLSVLQDKDNWGTISGESSFLNNLIANYSTYPVSVNGGSERLINYKNLLRAIFNEIQIVNPITLDFGDVFATPYWVEPGVRWYGNPIGVAGTLEPSTSGNSNDVWFLPEQIIGINQNGIFAPANIVGDDMLSKRPTLFDLLSTLCSILGVSFIPKSKYSFYPVSSEHSNPSANVALTDDVLYDIEVEKEIQDSTGVESSYETLCLSLMLNSYDSAAEWLSGINYLEGNIVHQNLDTYMCVTAHTSDVNNKPTASSGPNYWIVYHGVINLRYYVDTDPYLNGNNPSFYFKYDSVAGKNPTRIDWLDNFNPIIIVAGNGWVCTPVVDSDLSCAKYLVHGVTDSYQKVTAVVPANLVIGASWWLYESIYVEDINTNTVEIEYVI